APCSLSARPASHCSSVISNRSICGTAPAMLSRASMRPWADSVASTTRPAASGAERSASMTRASAPASRTRRAVSSSLSRLRATSATAPKSRASLAAVALPMPWLAPVTIATDLVMVVSPLGWRGGWSVQEAADLGGDLGGVGLQREVAGVEEHHLGLRQVAPERLGARRQEERV